MTSFQSHRPIKLAYVTVRLPGGASGEEFLVPEIRELAKLGYRLVLIPREHRGQRVVRFDSDDRIVVNAVGLHSWEVISAFLKSAFHDWQLIGELVRDCFKGAKLLDGLKNVRVLAKGVWLGRLAQKESIEHIHAHWAATTATLAEIAHRVSGVPWSLTLHRGDIVQNNRLKEKAMSAAFTRFISHDGLRLYKEVTGRDPVTDGNVKVIHMGVTIPPAERLAPLPRTSPFNLVCAANLVAVKGHLFLFQAVELLRRRGVAVRLFVIGEGVLRAQLEAWVRDYDLEEWVTFTGQQSHSTLLAGYRERQFHAVALASIDLGRGEHEGIPVCLMEGMACGLPVISTNTGGIPELLERGAGVLVPPQDAVRLADAIARLARDHDFAVETARRGRERVISEFNASKTVQDLSDALETAATTKPS